MRNFKDRDDVNRALGIEPKNDNQAYINFLLAEIDSLRATVTKKEQTIDYLLDKIDELAAKIDKAYSHPKAY